ncbi:hypothetical protein E0Z10_g6311 [Xylaria hypoxylon]|uniref:F-box domain-containing protein n=1 Tax=Xylaria hypoxylon TaxID=37992 RepID=A0A4Z0YTL2_9PEZI|nr:hypothetical protein E0Z10_g6311 [Xylaria hypoxylon]
MSSSLEAKIVVLGSQGVGKTSLVTRYCKGAFSPAQTTSTVGASFMTKRVVDSDTDTVVRLQIWDTAGQERFRSISRLYYRGANACILCYSITDAHSFAEMGIWLTELRRNLPPDIVLHVVGTKADIVAHDPTRREVPFERCIAYVAENLAPGLGSTPPPTATPGGVTGLSLPLGSTQSHRTTPGTSASMIASPLGPTPSSAPEPRSPSSKRSSGFWGQEVGWDACHEISAESGEGVEEVFRVVTRKLVEQNRKIQQAILAATSTPGLSTPGTEGTESYFDGVNPRGSFRVGRDRRSWLFSPGFSPAVTIENAGNSSANQQNNDADNGNKRQWSKGDQWNFWHWQIFIVDTGDGRRKFFSFLTIRYDTARHSTVHSTCGGSTQPPAELFLQVLSYLSIKDLAAVALTCRGYHTLAKSLLYELEVQNPNSFTFYAAARSGHVGRMQKLIDAGFDVNRKWVSSVSASSLEYRQLADRWGDGKRTTEDVLLYYSKKRVAKSNRYQSLRDDISSQPDFGWESFGFYTAANGKDDAVSLLLDNGADISAASRGFCDCRQVMAFLISPNVGDFGPLLWSPLHVAICHRKSSTFSTAALLLQRGAPINLNADESGNLDYDEKRRSGGRCTALHAACFYGPHLLVEWLVECGYQSDVEAKDRIGQTPLAYSFCASNFLTVKYLVKKGADININLGNKAGSPLLMACKARHYTDAIELVKLGADVNLTDSLRHSSLHILAMRRTGWMNREKQCKLVHELLKKGARFDGTDGSGWTPLCFAEEQHNVDVAKILIEYGAKSVFTK